MNDLNPHDSVPQATQRDIPGYEGMYQIDLRGNVYAMFKYRDKQPGWAKSLQTNSDGYRSVVLRGKTCFVHRLMLLTFEPIDNPHEMEVNHIDGDKANNNLANLEWVTHRENIHHAHYVIFASIKNQVRGVTHGRAKLTEDNVREIRHLATIGVSFKSLAERFGVSAPNISFIVSRKLWPHID